MGTSVCTNLDFGTEIKCTRAMIVESAMTVLQRLHQGYFSKYILWEVVKKRTFTVRLIVRVDPLRGLY